MANENLSDKELVDIVIPIPDSGNASALGFAEKIEKDKSSKLKTNHLSIDKKNNGEFSEKWRNMVVIHS